MKEIITRLRAKSPTLFKWIGYIGIAATFVSGLPEVLTSYGISIPEAWQLISSKTVAIAGAIAAFVANLTVDTPRATENVIEKIENGVKPEVASKSA